MCRQSGETIVESAHNAAGCQRLAGRRIIITGAASGIGKAMAELFRREGAALALIDRDAKGLEAVAGAIDALPLTLDLAEGSAIGPTVDHAARELGGLDGVVNCAAFSVAAAIEDSDPAYWDKTVAINLTAPYLLCRAAVRYLREAEIATIVNIASGLGILPNSPNNTAYSATKGGLIAFSKALAAELAPHVRVNVVAPGVTNTPMAAPLFAGYNNPNDAPWVKQYALQRVAEPIEIAHAALFLTSVESSYVTGIALAADGGRTFH
jgi:NAD(P)-dependent dehydrogenase (short-subunit alcohol dehydrogenase family)